MKVLKRIIAVFCAVCLVCGLVPLTDMQTVEAENTVVVAKETKIVKYNEASPKVAPTDIPEGYVFAGWYQQQACTDWLTVSGPAYAKFVDENIFRVKAQITADTTAEKDMVAIRVVTSVDSLFYNNIGFEITINGATRMVSSKTVYDKLYAVGETSGETLSFTPAEVFCSASKYFKTYTIEDVPNVAFGSVISVRACWKTQDGTVVYGEATHKTIDMGIFGKEAVDYGTVFHCDNKDYLVKDAGNAAIDSEDYKEGAGALSVKCASTDVLVEFNRGEHVVDISEYADGYLHFWFYVNDTSFLNGSGVSVELSSGGKSDVEELQWSLSNLTNGWNEIALPFSTAEKTGSIDYEEIDYFRIFLSQNACKSDMVVKVDDVRAVAAGEILDCDTEQYLTTPNGAVSVITNHYKEGSGALQTSVTGDVWYAFQRSAAPINAEQYAEGRLEFWLYINDVRKLNGGSLIYVELGSAGQSDQEELEWRIPKSDLTDGWNRISLPIAEPTSATGNIQLSAIDFFRIWHSDASDSLVTILDDVRVVEPEAQMIDTVYDTKDIVIADIIPTEMNYAVDKTGATDSTAGIQAALNDCYAAGGGTVYLPAGTYVISDTIDIPSYVTLRGDWRDPDEAGTDYGTVIRVEMDAVNSSDEDAVTQAEYNGIFELHGVSGAVGLTVYYPEQNISNVKIYPHTFYVVGIQEVKVMLPTVRNVTVINGYRGIGASIDQGSHESMQIENFKGTFLHTGIYLQRSADVGNGKNISISNRYWINSSLEDGNRPDETTLDTYTRNNAVGFTFGSVEWSQFTNVTIEDCNVGIQTVEARESRPRFAGSFYDLHITDCHIGVDTDYLDMRWGMNIAKSSIAGSKYGIQNNGYKSSLFAERESGYIQLCDVEVSGGIGGWAKNKVIVEEADLSSYQVDYDKSYVTPDERMIIANLSADKDASVKLQACLNWMSKAGGGVVYVPAGIYSFYQPVVVPAGVELRGSATVATRDQEDVCEGTLFFCYYGDEGGVNDTAFITLAGENAGLNGVRIVYPNNGVLIDNETNKTYKTTYTVRGKAEGVYMVNSMIAASGYGVDFRDCDNHYIERVVTCCYYNTFYLGGTGGTISNCLQNHTVLRRTAAPLNTTSFSNSDEKKLLFGIMKQENHYIILQEAEDEVVYNTFAYGAMTMLTNLDSTGTQVINMGTDKVGASSAQLVMDGGSMTGVNILRSNTTSEEAVNTTLDGAYLTSGIASKSYKYIAGALNLYNRLLMVLEDGEESCEDIINIQASEKEGTETRMIYDGTLETTGTTEVRNLVFLDTPVDLDLYEQGTLHLRLYINDMKNLTSNAPFYLEISSARRSDCEELQWVIPLNKLQSDWNDITLRFEDATANGIIHIGAIDYIRLYHVGNSEELVTCIENIYADWTAPAPDEEEENSDLTVEENGGSNSSDWKEWFE